MNTPEEQPAKDQLLRERQKLIHYPYACLGCRRSFKRNVAWTEPPERLACPHCGGPALCMSRKFKAPRRSDIAQWKKVGALAAAGFRFDSLPAYQPYPAKLRDVAAFVREHGKKQIP